MTSTCSNLDSEQPERRSQGSRAQRFLAEAGEILATSLNYEETLASVAQLAVPEIADWCSVNLVTEAGAIARVGVTHIDPDMEHLLDRLRAEHIPRLNSDHPLATAIDAGRPVLIASVTDADLQAIADDERHLNIERELGTRSVIIAPLSVRGRVFGAITLATSTSKRVFNDADVATVEDLARRAAVAIDNARLYQEAREAEARVRHQAARLEGLAEASNAFAMARLDLDTVLQTVVRRVAELLGDVCSIRLISDDGTLILPVAFHHTNPAAFEVFKTLRSFGPRGVHEGTIGQVVKTGEPLLVVHQTVEDWRKVVLSDWFPYIEQFGMHSILIVPLRAVGTTIGTLGLWRESTPDAFTLEDQHFVQDLADRAGLAIVNARLYTEAQAAIAARDEFLSVAAHELKTPVTSLRGYAQLLLRRITRGEDISPERLRGALSSIDRQTWRLSALISQLLDTSRIHSGELAVQTSSTDIVELISELVEHARTLSDTHAISIDIKPPLAADIDSLRIEQVLTNLVENAIKYSPSGGAIVVEAHSQADGWLRVAVQDNGPGIPESERDRIFDRFYQIHSDGSASGMGLGLYISRQIVELHGGTIAVEAPEAGGTRFVIVLPMSRPGGK